MAKHSLSNAIGNYFEFVCRRPRIGIPLTLGGLLWLGVAMTSVFGGAESGTVAPVAVESEKPTAVVVAAESSPQTMTTEEKASNDAAWEAKQIAASQPVAADSKEAQRFAACTAMDQGGWLNDGGPGYLQLHTDAMNAMCPWHKDLIGSMWAQRNATSDAELDAAQAATDSIRSKR